MISKFTLLIFNKENQCIILFGTIYYDTDFNSGTIENKINKYPGR